MSHPALAARLCKYTHIHTYRGIDGSIYIYIYIYIERERERVKERVFFEYTYIHIFKEMDGEREREREREEEYFRKTFMIQLVKNKCTLES